MSCRFLPIACFPVLLTVLAPHLAWADCGEGVTSERLARVLERAELHAGRNAHGFGMAAEALADQLPCLSEPQGPLQAARIHRVQGLAAFVGGDRQGCQQAFAASQRLEPDFSFSHGLFPEAHPIARLFVQARGLQLETSSVPRTGGQYWFDGLPGNARPANQPSLVQLQDSSGRLLASAYLWPGDALPTPTPPLVELAAQPTLEVSGAHEARRGPHVALTIGAGLSALAAGGCYAVALAAANDYRENPHSDAELVQLRTRANGLVFVSAGLGALAVGTGVGAVVTWPR